MKTIIALLLLTTTAFAQDTLTPKDREPYPDVVQRPSDEDIRRALMGAYIRNGYSMKGGMSSIDMSNEDYKIDRPVSTKKGDRK